MASDIRFEKHDSLDPKTKRKRDEVVVIRDGREVAVLPEASRLDRALSLPLEEAVWITRHFKGLMHSAACGPQPKEDVFHGLLVWQNSG